MDYQDRYDELDNIVRTLDILIDETTDEYYINIFNEIKCEAQDELEEVDEKLQAEQDMENKQQEREYWEEAI